MIFRCKNCGGNVIYNSTSGTMYCPHCNEEDIGEFEGEFKSDDIIPFQLEKETAWKVLKRMYKKAVTTPDTFLDESTFEQLQGIYIPYWICDYKCNYDFASKGVKSFIWREVDMQYVERDSYHVVRNMDVDFKQFPVCASQLFPEEIMKRIEPYDYSQIKTFTKEDLDGYSVESCQLEGEELEKLARKKMKAKAEELLNNTLAEYTEQMPEDMNLFFWKEKQNLVLMPVWKYHYFYRDQSYDFYLNGQTGRVIGTAPVSWQKTITYAATVFAGAWALTALIINILEVI